MRSKRIKVSGAHVCICSNTFLQGTLSPVNPLQGTLSPVNPLAYGIIMELWNYGIMELWSYGIIALRI